MNTLDKFVYVYEFLHNRKGLHPYALSPLRRSVRLLANKVIPNYFKKTPIKLSDKQSDIVVSLTSFPARIYNVHLVIQCILRQTILPRKILLWLSQEQFEGIELPRNLTDLRNDIFEIRFVKGDIRSHKKYHYVLSEYPDSKIVLIDDDLFYPTDMLEKMSNASDEHPDSVICRYGSIMKFNNGTLLPYNAWWYEIVSESDDPNFFFGTGGGVLLKKTWLYKDVLNVDLAIGLTPLADDVWLNAMVNLKGTPKYKINFGQILPITIDNNEKLSVENVQNDRNTEQIETLTRYYQSKYNMDPFMEGLKLKSSN